MPKESPPSQKSKPPRAVPITSPTPVTKMEYAAWQVRLEWSHFSCGTIDGIFGKRSKRAITQFQINRKLPITGELDIETRIHLGTPGNPFKTYIITQEDLNRVQPTPLLWKDKAKATYLGYNSSWEMVAEKFHSTPAFIQKLNPEIMHIGVGTSLTVPNLSPSQPLPKASKIKIILPQTTLLAYSKTGLVLACFPCSIARDKNKRPNGQLVVINKAPNPNYTFNPATFPSIAEKEGITEKMIIPPGPNNPVGSAWMGLSLPGYGIHGTPEPTDISRTGSSGCFRLANWNAKKLIRMVDKGTPVEIIE